MTQPTKPIFGQTLSNEEARHLVDAWYDGHATSEQRKRLESLIRSSKDVRYYLIAHAQLISGLIVEASTPQETQRPDSPPERTDHHKPVTLLRFLSLAASLLLLATGGYLWDRSKPGEPAPQKIGTLHRISHYNANLPTDEETILREETALQLQSGEYEIRLENGVVLAVAAPADILVQNLKHCRLDSGRITATVPPNAEGFRVFTSLAEIVDHGTRFGVAVTPSGDTDVAVFEGEVEVHSSDDQKSLRMGRAVSIASNGSMSRMQYVTPDSFANTQQVLGSVVPVVVSVCDNIRSPEELSYYRIIHGGFQEDQRAYVDRVHQWNGIDSEGLPQELLGADCIMTFNDDKSVRDIEITITLAQQADVYLLLDERVDVPDWLRCDFTKTPMKVGMDEGERPGRPEDPRTLGKGAGQSVDYRFSVWKRNTPSNRSVVIGGLPKISEWQSMYGILAKPVRESSDHLLKSI